MKALMLIARILGELVIVVLGVLAAMLLAALIFLLFGV